MYHAMLGQTATEADATAHRHAYNAAFEELGLTWHWDPCTYARLTAHGRDGLRVYLETEQAHLLRAYEADFLVDAIERAKARCYDQRAFCDAYPATSSRHAALARERLTA